MSYKVTIEFTDGIYKNNVIANSATRAMTLAKIDARMANSGSAYYGRVLSVDVKLN
jgi:hypothetical protein